MRSWMMAAMIALLPGMAVAADNWADEPNYADMAASKTVCRQLRSVHIPAPDRTDQRQAQGVGGCDSEALYYGIGHKADPARAFACAMAEAGDGDGPFSGNALLMVMYANGIGTKRDLDKAIAIACTLGGAPAEIDGRVLNLAEAKKNGPPPTDFSWCQDITSGYAAGVCAAHESRIAQAKRDGRKARFPAQWRGAALTKLENAHAAFAESHANTEQDMSGTLRGALATDASEQLAEELMTDLDQVAAGNTPWAGDEQNTSADAELNAVYRQVMAVKRDDQGGTVTNANIRATQRLWITFRDAWVSFAMQIKPDTNRQAVINWLTARRTAQLKELQE